MSAQHYTFPLETTFEHHDRSTTDQTPSTSDSMSVPRDFQHVKDYETMVSIIWQMLIEEDSEKNYEAGAEVLIRAHELRYAGETKRVQEPQWAEEHLDDLAEILEVATHWNDALNTLDNLENVPKDISSRDLLLCSLDHSVEEGQATIIDLGLTHLETRSGDEQLSGHPLEALGWPATPEDRKKPDPHGSYGGAPEPSPISRRGTGASK